MPMVLEDPAVVDALLSHCKDESFDADLLRRAGLLNDAGYLTDNGIIAAEAVGVLMKELHLITLGREVVCYTQAQEAVHLKPGSDLLVLFGGRDPKGARAKWYDCFVAADWPTLKVYHSSADKFRTEKWPATKQLPTHFLVPEGNNE